MKKILLTFLALTILSSAQEGSSQPQANEDEAQKPRYQIELEALTEPQKEKYFIHYFESDRLFQQKRIFECLNELYELHKIVDTNPASLNLLGACYVEFRNFNKARSAFAKALKESPGNFNVRFNLAEVSFVTQDFKKARTQFLSLKNDAQSSPKYNKMGPLVDFKLLLCNLKLNKVDAAKSILDGIDFLDDSPLFYYGNAALEYFENRRPEAEIWLARADRIFGENGGTAAWQDTLIEFGYIESFYGGDLEVDSSPIGE